MNGGRVLVFGLIGFAIEIGRVARRRIRSRECMVNRFDEYIGWLRMLLSVEMEVWRCREVRIVHDCSFLL